MTFSTKKQFCLVSGTVGIRWVLDASQQMLQRRKIARSGETHWHQWYGKGDPEGCKERSKLWIPEEISPMFNKEGMGWTGASSD